MICFLDFVAKGYEGYVQKFWIFGFRKHESLVRSRTIGVTEKRVEKSGIGGRAHTMAGAGPTDLLYLEEGGRVGVQGAGPWLGGEKVLVFVCTLNGVALLGAAVWGLCLHLLDGYGGANVLRCLWVYGRGVRPHSRGVYAVRHHGYRSGWAEGVVGASNA